MEARSGISALGPHRAYRRLSVLTPTTVGLSVLLMVGLECGLLLFLPEVVRVFGFATFAMVRFVGTAAWLGNDEFLGVPLFPIVFGSIPPADYQSLLAWLGGSVAGILALRRAQRVVAPLRFLLVYNLLLMAASALYLLFAGHLGYDAEEFSRLYLRTVVIIWLVTPVFMAALSLTLPFSPLDRVGLIVLTLLYDVTFSAVRYALFVWLLTRLGAVVMANLYLFLGPLLDVVYFVGIFALFVLRLTRRLGRNPEFQAW